MRTINFSDFTERDEWGHYLCFVPISEVIRKFLPFLEEEYNEFYYSKKENQLSPEEKLVRAIQGERDYDFIEYLKNKYAIKNK